MLLLVRTPFPCAVRRSGVINTRFSFLGLTTVMEIYSVFETFALFINLQIECTGEDQKALLQALVLQRATCTTSRRTASSSYRLLRTPVLYCLALIHVLSFFLHSHQPFATSSRLRGSMLASLSVSISFPETH